MNFNWNNSQSQSFNAAGFNNPPASPFGQGGTSPSPSPSPFNWNNPQSQSFTTYAAGFNNPPALPFGQGGTISGQTPPPSPSQSFTTYAAGFYNPPASPFGQGGTIPGQTPPPSPLGQGAWNNSENVPSRANGVTIGDKNSSKNSSKTPVKTPVKKKKVRPPSTPESRARHAENARLYRARKKALGGIPITKVHLHLPPRSPKRPPKAQVTPLDPSADRKPPPTPGTPDEKAKAQLFAIKSPDAKKMFAATPKKQPAAPSTPKKQPAAHSTPKKQPAAHSTPKKQPAAPSSPKQPKGRGLVTNQLIPLSQRAVDHAINNLNATTVDLECFTREMCEDLERIALKEEQRNFAGSLAKAFQLQSETDKISEEKDKIKEQKELVKEEKEKIKEENRLKRNSAFLEFMNKMGCDKSLYERDALETRVQNICGVDSEYLDEDPKDSNPQGS